ncbi:MAG: site-specific integrase, partial [Nitrosomonadaceae bacterium]
MTSSNNPASLVVAYIFHLANERRLSPLTCESYSRDIATLLKLATETPFNQLQIHHVRRFVARLHSKGLSGRSLARMLSAWRGFYNYLARDHGYTYNPCAGLRAPKSPKTLPNVLSPDEAAKLLEFPAN